MIWSTRCLRALAITHLDSIPVNNLKSVSQTSPWCVLNNRCGDRWISYLPLAPQLSPQGPAPSPGSSACASRVWTNSMAECLLLARWCCAGTGTGIPPNARYETNVHSHTSAHSDTPRQKRTYCRGAARKKAWGVGWLVRNEEDMFEQHNKVICIVIKLAAHFLYWE